MTGIPYPPIPASRAINGPVRIVTRNPYRWRVALIVGLGFIAVGIAGAFLWTVVALW